VVVASSTAIALAVASLTESGVDAGEAFGPEHLNFNATVGARFLPWLMQALFGQDGAIVVSVVQAVMMGLTVLAIALMAQVINRDWFWPSAVLGALWPNMVWRVGMVSSSEPSFLVFLAWALCACVWAMKSEHPARLLVRAGLAFGVAFLIRSVLLLLPFFIIPALAYALKSKRRNWVQAVGLAILPIVVMWIVGSVEFVRNRIEYGHFAYAPQGGFVMALWTYPCLSQRFGCGDRDQELVAEVNRLAGERVSQLPQEDREDRFEISRVYGRLGTELIMALPIDRLVVSALGGFAKLMGHTVWLDVMRSEDVEPVYFSRTPGEGVERLSNFLGAVVASPWMAVWLIFQLGLLASRGLQVFGLIGGISDPATRRKMIFLVAAAVSMILPAVGAGTIRYRVPIEPILVVLTVAGWTALVRLAAASATRRTKAAR